MVVLPRDYKYRDAIFEAITKALKKPLNYSKTYSKTVEKLNFQLSHRDYVKHVNKMADENWIIRTDSKNRGTPVELKLTEKAKKYSRLKIDVLEGNKYELAYQFLLHLAASGQRHYVKVTQPQAGSVARVDRVTGRVLENLNLQHIEGVSETDMIRKKHYGSAGIFRYLDFTDEEVSEYFKLLMDEKILIPIGFRNKDEVVCAVSEALKNFLIDSWDLAFKVISRMQLVWENIRPPLKSEKEWYEIFFGERETMRKFAHFNSVRTVVKKTPPTKTNMKDLRDDVEKKLERTDSMLLDRLERIKKTHGSVISQYAFLADTALNWSYPQFIKG